MGEALIQTRKTASRRPGVAFMLSLVFPGLGQMYTGDLAGGIAFTLLRPLAIVAAPVWAAGRNTSAVDVIIVFMLIAAVLTIASPVEARMRARRNAELPVRSYNAAGPYILFTIAGIILHCAAIMALAAFFSIRIYDGFRAGPLLSPGDLILVRHYIPDGPQRGDLALLDDGSAARVIALSGDRVKYVDNIFFINGRKLSLGYLDDTIIARFAADRGDVLSETGDAGPYPVRFRQSPDITLQGVNGLVGKESLLVACDTRLDSDFARIVRASSFSGRVEGVLFSRNFRKIGMDASGDLQ